jgi:hypothetical protein
MGAPLAKRTIKRITPLITALQVAEDVSENPKTHGEMINQIPTKTLMIFMCLSPPSYF